MFMDKRTEQAFAYLEKNEHSMMELLKNLVSIETPSADREANERIAAHLDTYCDALGMERQISSLREGWPNISISEAGKEADSSAWAYGYSSCGWKVRPGTVSCEG